VIVFELPKETPEKPKYVLGVDTYTETALRNTTILVDKQHLVSGKLVAHFCTRR